MNVTQLKNALFREGGHGSGRHKTVDDAIDAYNAKARAKMHPPKKESFPFTNVYRMKSKKQAATGSSAPGVALTRAGVRP